jgi:hypothetical protein
MKEKIAQEKEELEKVKAEELEKAKAEELAKVEVKTEIEEIPVESCGVVSSQEPSVSSVTTTIESEIEMKDSQSTTPSTDSEPMLVDEVINVEKEQPKVIEPEPEKVEIEKVHEVEAKEEELSPFEELIRVASLLNPKQFELPIEMTEPFPFPGTERVEPIRNGRRVKNKRLVEVDSHGCVPLPAKLCFACHKSCKKAPLISCDYCTLFFHQDCLDPPMTALPAGRWMCPNHPQHFIVSFNIFFILSLLFNILLF